MSYSTRFGMSVAKLAAIDITNWLSVKPETISVTNVEDDLSFQSRDVDLIWTTQTGEVWLEIKGDRWHKTGNFFFETDSNYERGTPGCFMYTQANWILYYFVTPRTLYWLPMPMTRDWFLPRRERFRERSTTTPVKGTHYTTKGCLVPIKTVMLEVKGVKLEQLGY